MFRLKLQKVVIILAVKVIFKEGWLHESEGWYYLGSTLEPCKKGWYLLMENGTSFKIMALWFYSQWFKWVVFGITSTA